MLYQLSRKNIVGRPLSGDNFWLTFSRIQTSDLLMLLSDNIPADVYESYAVVDYISRDNRLLFAS